MNDSQVCEYHWWYCNVWDKTKYYDIINEIPYISIEEVNSKHLTIIHEIEILRYSGLIPEITVPVLHFLTFQYLDIMNDI